ncbi:hypothetical protein [uncultured Ruthenibacterium sp.]|uniref:hypothetical protein n=1 Tax=uncultured Ruthenibacterium sp. TaxID=1905347 RepID=UPI00349EC6A2
MNSYRSDRSRRVALGGVFTSLSVVVMLLGGIFPFATFSAPAIAGLLIVPVAIEFGLKMGYILYIAISILSLFIVPDKEMSLIFVFLFGFYPLLKANLERIHSKIIRWSAKIGLFNGCVVCMYSLILFLFPIGAVVEEFEEMGTIFLLLLLLMGNLAFVIYDIALVKLIGLYCAKMRPKLMNCH